MPEPAASTRGERPADRLYAIVEQALCIGCGLCESVAGRDSVEMVVTPEYNLRPRVVGELDHATVDHIYNVCPGTRVDGVSPNEVEPGIVVDEIWGPVRRIVRAWAGDAEVRHEGSTAGVLTAVGQYLLSSGRVSFILHTRASSTEPAFGEATISRTPEEVLEAAGSRYGPTDTLSGLAEALDLGEPFAFIAKPCDISALRNQARHDPRIDELVRYRLAMVCGGFGTRGLTERFLDRAGIDPGAVTGLRYRGRGCPGPTTVTTAHGSTDHHYLDYWGDDESQWSLPWRCKICADGIGEASDLAVADTWVGGSPNRIDSETDPGVNVVVARTQAGAELLDAAAAAGALSLGDEATIDDLSAWQPHQVNKKRVVAARHRAIGEVGRIVPQVNHLRIAELGAAVPVEITDRQRRGTLERIADAKATEARPVR